MFTYKGICIYVYKYKCVCAFIHRKKGRKKERRKETKTNQSSIYDPNNFTNVIIQYVFYFTEECKCKRTNLHIHKHV